MGFGHVAYGKPQACSRASFLGLGSRKFTIGAIQIDNMLSVYEFVIPAQAGIQWHLIDACKFHWTPACAGVTDDGFLLNDAKQAYGVGWPV